MVTGSMAISLTSKYSVRVLQQFAGRHLYSWWEIGDVRVTSPAQEHSVIVPAEAGRLSLLIRNLFNALIGFKMDLSRCNQDGDPEESVD